MAIKHTSSQQSTGTPLINIYIPPMNHTEDDFPKTNTHTGWNEAEKASGSFGLFGKVCVAFLLRHSKELMPIYPLPFLSVIALNVISNRQKERAHKLCQESYAHLKKRPHFHWVKYHDISCCDLYGTFQQPCGVNPNCLC